MDCPAEFRKYEPILDRLGPFRSTGDGLTFKCIFALRHKHGDRTPSLRLFIGKKDGALFARCMGCQASHDEIVKAVGLPVTAWFPQATPLNGTTGPKPKFVCQYVYHDAAGRTIAVKSRYEPGWHGAKKSFLWRREIRDAEVHRQVNAIPNEHVFAYSLEAGYYRVARRVGLRIDLAKAKQGEPGATIQLPSATGEISLYKLHAVAKASKSVPVIVVEGEKDVDNLTRLKFLATTGYAGKGKWEPGWAKAFAGRRVVVCPDGDGESYGQKVAADCMWHRAAEVRIVRLPAERGNDISEFIGTATSDPLKSVIELFSRADRYILKGADCPQNGTGR